MSISDTELEEGGKKKARKKVTKIADAKADTEGVAEAATESTELPEEEKPEGFAEQASTVDNADSECNRSTSAEQVSEESDGGENKTADENEEAEPQNAEKYDNETFDFGDGAITDGGEEAAEDSEESVRENDASLPEEAEGEGEASDVADAEYENETFDFGESETQSADDEEAAFDESAERGKTAKNDEKYDPEKPRKADTRFDILEIFTFTLVAIILVTSFLFRHSVVEGGSMLNTLSDGDHLIITDLFYTPKRYDIVVFEDFSTGFDKALIKRVIATEGEVVRITADGEVFVDGEKIRDDFVHICHYNPDRPLEYTVGEGEVFVMGDHRCCSTDSRDFGAVSEDSILGKVILRFYPFPSFGTVD